MQSLYGREKKIQKKQQHLSPCQELALYDIAEFYGTFRTGARKRKHNNSAYLANLTHEWWLKMDVQLGAF